MKLVKVVAAAVMTAAVMTASPSYASRTAAIIVDPGTNAGYIITPASLHSVKASWTVPTIECTASKASVGTGILLGAGDTGHSVTLGVDIDCVAKSPVYRVYLQISDHRRTWIRSRVGPGDLIQASMKATKDDWSAEIENYTRGWAGIITGLPPFVPDQAGILVFQPRFGDGDNRYRRLADFGTVHFTGGRIDGQPIEGRLRRLNMHTEHSVAKARTSQLEQPHGDFDVQFLRSSE